jgi:hypothetical protein
VGVMTHKIPGPDPRTSGFATALRAREGVTMHRRLDMAARSEMLQADQVYATLSRVCALARARRQWIESRGGEK